jgi:hypothetical protein
VDDIPSGASKITPMAGDESTVGVAAAIHRDEAAAICRCVMR